MPIDDALRQELLALASDDLRVREQLIREGALSEGYNPTMEAVHRRNAARLRAIVAEGGWPGTSLVGADGAEAAWLIVQHAIGEPHFMRSCHRLLAAAVERGDAPPWQAAMLEDRINMFEGRPQRYGSQLEADAEGRPRPYCLEDPRRVEEWRREVGLEPLAERLARGAKGAHQPPSDPERREREYQEWLRRVGWRD